MDIRELTPTPECLQLTLCTMYSMLPLIGISSYQLGAATQS